MSTFIKEQPPAFTPGFYRHYKGKLYFATGLTKHSETLEFLVNYHEYGDRSGLEWSRPLSMWDEIVEDNFGNKVPRFMRFE